MAKKRAVATRVSIDGVDLQAWVRKRGTGYETLCLPLGAMALGKTVKEALEAVKNLIIAWKFPGPTLGSGSASVANCSRLDDYLCSPNVRSFKLVIEPCNDPDETIELLPNWPSREGPGPVTILMRRLLGWRKADPRVFTFQDRQGRKAAA